MNTKRKKRRSAGSVGLAYKALDIQTGGENWHLPLDVKPRRKGKGQLSNEPIWVGTKKFTPNERWGEGTARARYYKTLCSTALP